MINIEHCFCLSLDDQYLHAWMIVFIIALASVVGLPLVTMVSLTVFMLLCESH